MVVPVYNDAGLLGLTLSHLCRQTLPPAAYEIVVVDDGSTDETPHVIAAAARDRVRVRCVRLDTNRGRSAARNAGIRAALGAGGVEFVAFVDADCVADRLWLERLIRALDQRKVGAVTGCVQGVGNETLVGRYTALVAWEASRADAVVDRADYTAVGLAGCNACLRASVLKEVGLFDERLWISEDWDLGLRVVGAGWE
ncbi:MAG: glycosyltransferase family 2 protein, partial [Firmicutes bacterium]|nr:glycosyltransferase family 2 protein [Bacillota bacterium]